MMEAEIGEMQLTASQEMPRIAGKHQKVGRGKERTVPQRPQREYDPANTFISDS